LRTSQLVRSHTRLRALPAHEPCTTASPACHRRDSSPRPGIRGNAPWGAQCGPWSLDPAELRTFSECLLWACRRAHLDIGDRLGVPGRTFDLVSCAARSPARRVSAGSLPAVLQRPVPAVTARLPVGRPLLPGMASFKDQDLTDAEFRECDLTRARLIGVVMQDAVIDGLVTNLVVNGVEVTSYVEAGLDRRHPVRLLLRSAALPQATDHRALTQLTVLYFESRELHSLMPTTSLHGDIHAPRADDPPPDVPSRRPGSIAGAHGRERSGPGAESSSAFILPG
jgi:hypothetical protein